MYLNSTSYNYDIERETVSVSVDFEIVTNNDCCDINNYLEYIADNFDSIIDTDDYKKFLVKKKLSELSNK